MALHTPAIHPTRAPNLATMAWALIVVVAAVAVSLALIWSLSRPVTSAPERNAPYAGPKADGELYVVPPDARTVIVSHPSGFTTAYSPIVRGIPVGYPSGHTSTYSPLGAILATSNYPSGYTSTYNPLHTTSFPVVVP